MYPLHFRDGHLFLELEGRLWLFDTGAPASFGSPSPLTIEGVQFDLEATHMGLTPETLSEFISVECAGLLGADVLGRFDFILDMPNGSILISEDELDLEGEQQAIEEFMGIPIVKAEIGGNNFRMFFDTGAQISYFQDESLANHPSAGPFTDFYPGVGQFQTETHYVEISLGQIISKFRCGKLPGLLGATLMMAGTEGIIGNQILEDRKWGYFPRRNLLVL